MKTERYTTINGEQIDLRELIPPVSRFLERVRERAEAPSVSVEEIEGLVWSCENPLMEEHPARPGSAYINREAYLHPAFREMRDLIDRKRMQAGAFDVSAARARYTMTVPEAAERLGIHETSVRAAIKSGRLAAWKDGGTWRLDPQAVHSYKVSTRGARAEVQLSQRTAPVLDEEVFERAEKGMEPGVLFFREGTEGNYRLKVKPLGGIAAGYNRARGKHSPIQAGVIPKGWKRVAVLRSKKAENDHRLFILEPRERDNPGMDWGMTFAGFYVRGNFEIVEKINNSRQALERWKAL